MGQSGATGARADPQAEGAEVMTEQEKYIAREAGRTYGIFSAVATFAILIVCGGLYGCPQYNVYQQRMDGEAQLAHAHASRQVQIQDAQSKLEASKSLADAEIERARGIAEANKIVGESLAGERGQAYLRYLYIDGLKDKDNVTTIYVPTEAGLPILEAGKRN